MDPIFKSSYGFIRRFVVTPANIHDDYGQHYSCVLNCNPSQVMDEMLAMELIPKGRLEQASYF